MLTGTVACIVLSVVYNFERSTATHCRVANYLPSISSAIGGYTPQRYIWRICIALQLAPRIIAAVLHYNFYTSFYIARSGIWCTLAALCSLLHILENVSLVTLSYVSSTENYDIHESSFYFFVLFSWLYMIMTCVLFRKVHEGQWSEKAEKSYRYKLSLLLVNFSCLLLVGYLFYRHNTYCEAGVYTLFAAAEYGVVLSNIAFHGSSIIDFGKGMMRFTLPVDSKTS